MTDPANPNLSALHDLCARVEADAVSALRYIEGRYGRLEGVGWDRVFNAHNELFRRGAALSAPSGSDLGEGVDGELRAGDLKGLSRDEQMTVMRLLAVVDASCFPAYKARHDDDLRNAVKIIKRLSTPSSTITPDADAIAAILDKHIVLQEWPQGDGWQIVGFEQAAREIAARSATPAIRDQAFEKAARVCEEWQPLAPDDAEQSVKEAGWLASSIAFHIRALKGTPPSTVDAGEIERENVLLRGKLAEAAAARDAAPSPDLLRELVEDIASGEAFREQRFAEDDDADYFLRAQRTVQKRAAALLKAQQPGDTA